MSIVQCRINKLRELTQRFKSVAEFARHYNLNEVYIRLILCGKCTFGEKAAQKLGKKIAGDQHYFDLPMLAETVADYATMPPLTEAQRQIVELMHSMTDEQQKQMIEQAECQVKHNHELMAQLLKTAKPRLKKITQDHET